jgi:hypothetical protein
MALLGRIVVVFFAFLIASVSAAIVVSIGMMLPAWRDLLTFSVEQGTFSVVVGIGAFFISALALLPAAIVIAIAEAFRLRSVLLYAAVGGLGLLALYYGAGFTDRMSGGPMSRETEIVAAAGIVAGLVYWLLAGRNAGKWREPAQAAPVS